MKIDLRDIDILVEKTGKARKDVIPLLQAIQQKYNYLPEEVLRRVCEITDITPENIIGVASFYSQFRFKPAGKHLIKVCVGTACHVKGAGLVYDALKRELKLEEHQDTDVRGMFTIEKVNCLGCCTLAPVVQIDHVTYGHVTTGQVGNIIRDFEKQRGKGGKKIFKNAEGELLRGEIRIGLGSCCVASGSEAIRETITETVQELGLDVRLKHVGCVGMCHQVPLMEIVPSGGESVLYSRVNPLDVREIIERHFQPRGFLRRLGSKVVHAISNIQNDSGWDGIERYELDIREKHVSSFLGRQLPLATEYRGTINPLDVDEYRQRGGFQALRKCLTKMSPGEIIQEIMASGLRGRGGAGFPTGQKWKIVSSNLSEKKYMICNGDEGDPGAFMDRMLLESYPFRVIEGMIIAAYAVGATEGIFYIRAEYPLAVSRVSQALAKCREEGFLG